MEGGRKGEGRKEIGEEWKERKGRGGHEGRKRGRGERERGLLIRTDDFQSSDFSHPQWVKSGIRTKEGIV